MRFTVYNKYIDNNKPIHIIVNNKEKIIKLIESSIDGNIRIWNFHSGILLKNIKVNDNYALRQICLLDDDYLYVGSDDSTIKLIDYKNGKMIEELKGHKNKVITVKKIIHPLYGKCLITQAAYQDSIRLWIIKNY